METMFELQRHGAECDAAASDNVLLDDGIVLGLEDDVETGIEMPKEDADAPLDSDEFATPDDTVAIHCDREAAEAMRAADSTYAYLRRIGKTALLKAEEEVAIAKRIEAGQRARKLLADLANGITAPEKLADATEDELRWVAADGARAKNEMLEANLRLVVSVAKRYRADSMTFLDIVQEGSLGLIRAVEKFDYTRGYKFSTYATWWIRQTIAYAVAEKDRLIRVPVHIVEDLNKLYEVRRDFERTMGRSPTSEELAQELKMKLSKVEDLLAVDTLQPFAYDQQFSDENDTTLMDMITDGDVPHPLEAILSEELSDRLEALLSTLSDREAGVILMRFGLGGYRMSNLREISAVYGVTSERIRQIEAGALKKLRDPDQNHALRAYIKS